MNHGNIYTWNNGWVWALVFPKDPMEEKTYLLALDEMVNFE